jgi:hypothetical protein
MSEEVAENARRGEVEAWGVTYERFAVEKTQARLVRKLGIESVLELPAHGTKAMPSIYSLGFGLAGAKVTLADGHREYATCWDQLGLHDRVEFVDVPDVHATGLPDSSWDLVWNFAYLPTDSDPDALVREMARVSKRYVGFFNVNAGNVGFSWHRFLHRRTGIAWTHGDVARNSRHNVARLLESAGLKVAARGFTDTPMWPDSLGFRDLRLHRENIMFDNVDWSSPYVEHRRANDFPAWVKAVYAWERIPMVAPVKSLYSHINFVIAEKA